jgi:hypothetical protein
VKSSPNVEKGKAGGMRMTNMMMMMMMMICNEIHRLTDKYAEIFIRGSEHL